MDEERDLTNDRIERLIKAGDELARALGSSPGIDPMRSVLLSQWRDAKLEIQDGTRPSP